MNKLLSLAVIASMSFTSMAADTTGFYLGAKAGSLVIDDDASSKADNATSAGFLIGYKVPAEGGDIAVEFEMNKAEVDFVKDGDEAKVDHDTMALYGAYRSEGSFFYKLKLGILKRDLKLDDNSVFRFVDGSTSDSDTGLSAGIGGGVRLANNLTIEAEYTLIAEDTNLFSLGVNYNF